MICTQALGGELKKSLDGHAETERRLRVEVDARRNDAAVLRAEAVEALRGRGEVDERLAGVALVAEQRQAARNSHLPPDFNGRVIEGCGPDVSAVRRALDESHRSVQTSAESM